MGSLRLGSRRLRREAREELEYRSEEWEPMASRPEALEAPGGVIVWEWGGSPVGFAL